MENGPHSVELATDEIIEILCQLTPRWQSFATEGQDRVKADIITRLIMSGFAKTKVCYRIVNRRTGEWVRLRFVVSGAWIERRADDVIVGPIIKWLFKSCDESWLEREGNRVDFADGISLQIEHDWLLAITEACERQWPMVREGIGIIVRTTNAPADIRWDEPPVYGHDPALATLKDLPPSEPPPSLWRFEPGEAIYKNIRIQIKGSAWDILKKLAGNFGRPVLKDALLDLMDQDSTASPETWLRDNLVEARNAVRAALELDKRVDPIPNTEKGRNAAWKLDDQFFLTVYEESTIRQCSTNDGVNTWLPLMVHATRRPGTCQSRKLLPSSF